MGHAPKRSQICPPLCPSCCSCCWFLSFGSCLCSASDVELLLALDLHIFYSWSRICCAMWIFAHFIEMNYMKYTYKWGSMFAVTVTVPVPSPSFVSYVLMILDLTWCTDHVHQCGLENGSGKINRKTKANCPTFQVDSQTVCRILLRLGIAQNFNVLFAAFINFYYVIEFVRGLLLLWYGIGPVRGCLSPNVSK